MRPEFSLTQPFHTSRTKLRKEPIKPYVHTQILYIKIEYVVSSFFLFLYLLYLAPIIVYLLFKKTFFKANCKLQPAMHFGHEKSPPIHFLPTSTDTWTPLRHGSRHNCTHLPPPSSTARTVELRRLRPRCRRS
jgi:hypothetical protein